MSLLVCGGIFVEELEGRPLRLGGSGFTAAISAARYGARVSLAGWVGAGQAEAAFARLDEAGVDRVGVVVLDGATTRYRIADPEDLASPMPGVAVGATPTGAVPALPWSPVVMCFGTPGYDVIGARWLDRAAEGSALLFDRQGSQSMVLGARMAATVPATLRILLGNVFEMRTETNEPGLARITGALPVAGFSAAFVKAGVWGVLGVGEGGAERPLGAYDVRVRSTIGSGDVFAGVLAGSLSRGVDVFNAAREAVAAAGAWIASGADVPPVDLPARAAQVAEGPAVWVDRRQLEDLRFELVLDEGVSSRDRERIGRALRYLGMETLFRPGASVRHIDLRGLGKDVVRDGVTRAVAWARGELGERT
ncbi:MAG: carbohydrate kinase family protein [Polyangiaceae bacterium]|nr:carbohydrate kinase family protein [Polyangiaceae bacterium]